MTCDLAASHAASPQPGLWHSYLAAAVMSAVLRVAAAEDSSRQYSSLFVSHLSRNSAKLDGQEADSFGCASSDNTIARPQLTAVQPGKLTDL